MIPSDVASRLQISADAALRPVAPTQEISDKLSGLIAGQRVMAEIQAMLPNGTYRAIINQRNVTLALPFSAKSGDSLELQVTESDGKVALAVVSHDGGESEKPTQASASATLSRTGQLISDLFSGARDAKGGPVASPLNANQPLASAPPASGQDLLPVLKQALSQSGMFYESHQAEWVEGRFTKTALLQEPQGKLSAPAAFVAENATPADDAARAALPKGSVATNEPVRQTALATDTAVQSSAPEVSKATQASSSGQVIAPAVQGLVQQQLEALATQNFVWQGQVWPGQEMRWEIDGDAAQREQSGEESAENWSTRLRLELPSLGEVEARIRLQGNQVSLSMSAGNAETRTLMRTASTSLRSQLDQAGLTLTALGIDAANEDTSDGQTGA